MTQLPPYDSFPEIQNTIVLLRDILPTEAEAIIDISYYNGKKATTVDDVLLMLAKIRKDYREGNAINWGIVEVASVKIAGSCGFYRGFENETGELGCILHEAFRGKGLMTSAMQLAIQFGWKQLQLSRIISITKKDNSKAIQLLKRLGFVEIAHLENNYTEYELKKPNT